MQIQKCPFCEGKGKVFDRWDQTSAASDLTCDKCKGKGWIEVDTHSISAQLPIHVINSGADN